MEDKYLQYWIEAVEHALEDAGIRASQDKIAEIAESMKISHENIDLAFGTRG